MDSVRSGAYGQLFRPDNFVFGKARSCYLFCTIWILFLSFLFKIDLHFFLDTPVNYIKKVARDW